MERDFQQRLPFHPSVPLKAVHATSLRNRRFRLLNAGGVLQSDSDSDDGGGGGDFGMEGEKNRDKAAKKGISAKEG